MKAVILAGGFGTRISEESEHKPKPMIEIGGYPILWHILKSYSHYGINDFIICAGYKQHVIKEYFANYYLHRSDITFDFTHENALSVHEHFAEPWNITIVDTGLNTMTGGRVKAIEKYVHGETFMLTYGDGVSDVDIGKLLEFHRSSGKKATLTAVQPAGRFGALDIDGTGKVNTYAEKKQEHGGWINGGFMVLEPDIFNYIAGANTTLEREPLEKLSEEGQLLAYKHSGFWQCMDTLRDKNYLEELWSKNAAPWKVWE
jgi:glucose-1-phosphate cytidylyltransferase